MGNYDNYCTCLGTRQEKTNNEIKTDSYQLPLKEEPVIVKKKKSILVHESNKYVNFIDKENTKEHPSVKNDKKVHFLSEEQKNDLNNQLGNNLCIRKIRRNNSIIKEIKYENDSSSSSSISRSSSRQDKEEKKDINSGN